MFIVIEFHYRNKASTIISVIHLLQKKVEPWKLYTMVSGLLVVDLIILLTWQLQDPLERRLETFPLEDPISISDDIKIRPELEHCESINNSVWLGEFFKPFENNNINNIPNGKSFQI